MTVSSTEGKTFIGIVVAGDDTVPDPYAMGRVKVLCPSIHHPNIKISDLPWCFMASQPDNIGGFSYNRPPPVGSIVEIFFSPGTKSTGQGMIRSVINGVHNPHAMMPERGGGGFGGFGGATSGELKPPGVDLSNIGYYAAARMQTPMMHSGPAIRSQEASGTAVTGSCSYGPYPPMMVRDGIDSSLANKAFVRTNFKINSISRAQQFAACIYDGSDENPSGTPKLEAIGTNIDAGQWIDYVTSRMCDEFLKMGARNYGKNLRIGYTTEKKNLNFVYSGPLTYDIGWRLKTLNMFTTTVINQKTLQDALWEMETSKYLNDCASCQMAIPSPCTEPIWEMMIKQDEQQCQKPGPKNDTVKHKINDEPISRTLTPCAEGGSLSVNTDEELGKKLHEDKGGDKLKEIEYAGGGPSQDGFGWLEDTDVGNLILRIQEKAQTGADKIRSRKDPFGQKEINDNYKKYKVEGLKIDRGKAV